MNYFNYESELVVALMLSGTTPDAVEVLDKIEPEMFSNGSMRDCYLAISDLYRKGLEFTQIEVSDKAGIGLSDLVELTKKSAGTPGRVKAYAKRVRQGYYLRKAEFDLSQVIEEIQSCNDESRIGEIAQMVESAVKSLVVETDAKKPRSAAEILERYVEIVDQRCSGSEEQRRVKFGVQAVDDKTQGINLTDLMILAGAPGMGKTELMMKIVNGVSDEKSGALVFSMEMDEYQLIERSIAIQSGLPISCARSPLGMEQDEWVRFSAGIGMVKEKQFHVLDQAGLSVNEICARATEHKTRFPNTRIICIDYVGLIPLQKADRHDIALGEVTRRLKQLAKDLKTPVLLLAQITSKDVEKRPNKRPMASDIKDSSRLQDDADWIIFPYRDEVYDENTPAKGVAEIIFAKARHGSKGTVYMGWVNGHFTEIDQAYADSMCRIQTEEKRTTRKDF